MENCLLHRMKCENPSRAYCFMLVDHIRYEIKKVESSKQHVSARSQPLITVFTLITNSVHIWRILISSITLVWSFSTYEWKLSQGREEYRGVQHVDFSHDPPHGESTWSIIESKLSYISWQKNWISILIHDKNLHTDTHTVQKRI